VVAPGTDAVGAVKLAERFRHHPRVRSVLVVCHGNLCRSSFAAGLLRSWLSSRGVRVESAGFVQPARPSPPEAVAAAARYGVDLSAHRSELSVARAADLIVVMDPGQRRRVCDRVGRSEHDVLVLAISTRSPWQAAPSVIP